jgi:hypothetical protein
LVYKLAWRATGDSVCAALLPFGFAFSYIGQACFFDLIPWFDGMAYCGLAVAMCFRNPAVIFLGMCFACWSDERAVVVSPLLLMWWVVQDAGQAQADARQRVLRNPQVWAMVLAVLSYVAGRLALGHLWQIRQWHKDLLPLGPWANRWPFFLVGLAISLKWLWLIVCGGGLAAFLNHKRWLAATMILFVVAYLGSCALVLDTTRSAAYAFPSVILGLACLSRTQPPKRVRWLIFGICVLCALTPSPFVIRNALIFMPNVFMPMGWSPLLIQDGRVTPLPTGW